MLFNNLKYYKGFIFDFKKFFKYSRDFKFDDYFLHYLDKDNNILYYFDFINYIQLYCVNFDLNFEKNFKFDINFNSNFNRDIEIYYDVYFYLSFEFDLEIKKIYKNLYMLYFTDFYNQDKIQKILFDNFILLKYDYKIKSKLI